MILDSEIIKDKFKKSTKVKYVGDAIINCEYKVNTKEEFVQLVNALQDKETTFVNFLDDAYKVTIAADAPFITKYVML